MNLKTRKAMIGRLYGVGLNRVKINPDRLEEVKEAITKTDLKGLEAQGAFTIVPAGGTSKARLRKNLEQKRKGRRQGKGSRKGKATARLSRKESWMIKVRAQREVLRKLKEKGMIEAKDYREAYRHVKGGVFRSKRHLKTTLEEGNKIKQNGTIQKKKTTKN